MRPLPFQSPLKPRVDVKRDEPSPVSWWLDPTGFYGRAQREQERLRRAKQICIPKFDG